MAIEFKQSSAFKDIRLKIENHIFESVFKIEQSEELALKAVEKFNNSLFNLMNTLEGMYQSPKKSDTQGEKSFPFHKGRYRLFFKVSIQSSSDLEITFLDIDDNKQSNLERFPEHLVSFDED